MKLTAFALVLLLISGGVAHAGDWVVAARGNTLAVGVDLSTLRTSDARRTYWSIWVTPTTLREEGMPHHDYKLRRDVIDCRLDTISTTTIVYYRMDGESVDSTTLSARTSDIVPGTVLEGVRDLVCDDEMVTVLRTYGVDTPVIFAADRRSGILAVDADWMARAR